MSTLSPLIRIYRLEQELLALKRRLFRIGTLAAGGGGAKTRPYAVLTGASTAYCYGCLIYFNGVAITLSDNNALSCSGNGEIYIALNSAYEPTSASFAFDTTMPSNAQYSPFARYMKVATKSGSTLTNHYPIIAVWNIARPA